MGVVVNGNPVNIRAEIYHYLAEALSEPPEWLSRPGPEWPLFGFVQEAAGQSRAAQEALLQLKDVPAGSVADRKSRYRAMLTGEGRRVPVALYESLHCSGRLAGPEMFAVGRIYSEYGLLPQSDELPDHASLELAFLAHLTELDAKAGRRRRREQSFIQKHAGEWLASVGHQMAASRDPVYAPVGRLLAGWLHEAAQWLPAPITSSVPVLSDPGQCILCGFCAQVCPTRTLVVLENEVETGLVRTEAVCTGCGRCVRHCEMGALSMAAASRNPGGERRTEILLRSPRVRCSQCGAATVSRAEIRYMARVIGQQTWLGLCLDCRARKEVHG